MTTKAQLISGLDHLMGMMVYMPISPEFLTIEATPDSELFVSMNKRASQNTLDTLRQKHTHLPSQPCQRPLSVIIDTARSLKYASVKFLDIRLEIPVIQ